MTIDPFAIQKSRDRENIIIRLYNESRTLDYIGAHLSPPLTRERVRQLIRRLKGIEAANK